MKKAAHLTVILLAAIASGPSAAQGTGQTSQDSARYSIDGRGGGIPTTKPQATQPVPPAVSLYPYVRKSRPAAPVGQQTNVPLVTR